MCTFYTLVNVYFLHIVQEDGRGAGREQVTREQDRREQDGRTGASVLQDTAGSRGQGGQVGIAKKSGGGNGNGTPTPSRKIGFRKWGVNRKTL